ncbi:MAG: deoxyribose-phosphate aldolase [Clostridia bacterium]|nr:deoxyribose-phosphate aldolase [Clostridia bacterium]
MKNINEYIDHTLLKADATPQDVEKLCDEAIKYGFYSVCINPCYVKFAKSKNVRVTTVIGFPLGATTDKAAETRRAALDGADEIDMVINVGMLKAKNYDYVRDEIASVRKEAPLLKVIIETCLLTDEEKVMACSLAKEAGADFVKTSTGFSTGGATVEDVKLMKRSGLKVKASGGIRDYNTAKALIDAGADRIGASKSIEICQGL